MSADIAHFDPEVVRSMLCKAKRAVDMSHCDVMRDYETSQLANEVNSRKEAGNPLSSAEVAQRQSQIDAHFNECSDEAEAAFERCETRYLRRPPVTDKPHNTPLPNA
jgi:hypothetical protein